MTTAITPTTQSATELAPLTATGAASTIRIPVTGMTCAACQARVQRTLRKHPGVADASVNLMMHDATISFDPSATSPEGAAIRGLSKVHRDDWRHIGRIAWVVWCHHRSYRPPTPRV